MTNGQYALWGNDEWFALPEGDERPSSELAAAVAARALAVRRESDAEVSNTAENAEGLLAAALLAPLERLRRRSGPSGAAIKIAAAGRPRPVAVLTHEWASRSPGDTPESVESQGRLALRGVRPGRRLRALETSIDESKTGSIVGFHHADDVWPSEEEETGWLEERCIFMIFPHAAPDALIVLTAVTTDANAFTDMLTEIGELALSVEYPVGNTEGMPA